MKRLIVALLLLSVTAIADDNLLGLWKAKRRFGPDARGTLVIRREAGGYAADMAGRIVPVQVAGGEMRFELPDGAGAFRGHLRDGAIDGFWFPPKGMGQNAGGIFVSPVRMKAAGEGKWIGQVVPFDDDFTFYLLLRQRPDGTTGAFLRNFERDFGGQIGVDQFVRDGNKVKLTSKRGDVNGTYDPERDVITLVFPNRGGSYDFTREGDDSDFYPRGRHPAPYRYRPPLARDDGWPTGTLEEAGIDRRGIEAYVQRVLDEPDLEHSELHGLLIARHGKLVLEEYFHGQNRDKLHETRSAAKSMTATLAGAAMHAGVPLQLSSRVYEVMKFPADDPRKKAMTLENLLTMAGGYDCDDTDPKAPGNEEIMINQEEEPDFYRFTLKVPMKYEPGEKSVYCSSNPNLALGMIGRAAGEWPLDLFDRLLARPMKIDRYAWGIDPAGNPYGGGSVQVLPRDFMKFGQLMLDGGTWRGRRLLSRAFVERASSRLYHNRNVFYGYLWWSIDYPYKDRVVRTYYAAGAGGQLVFVVPELDLVVAHYAGNYTVPLKTISDTDREFLPRFILPAVREPGDDKNAPVVWREFTSPYGPSQDGSRVH